jgi:hypothetical protein
MNISGYLLAYCGFKIEKTDFTPDRFRLCAIFLELSLWEKPVERYELHLSGGLMFSLQQNDIIVILLQ